MSDYYENVYLKRLNRYGNDYQSRIIGQRRKVFEQYLLKSVYRIDFDYNDNLEPGILEPYKQDETETMQYLLTDLDLIIPAGTIIEVQKEEDMSGQSTTNHWMVYWLEEKQASGYNRYVVLKMSHIISWVDRDGVSRETYAYFYGQEDNMLKDELKSRSRSHALYTEALKMSFFVMPFNAHIRKDDYFEVTTGADTNVLTEAYTVSGYDINSTAGVEYVTVDPCYIRDHSDTPVKSETDSDEDFYWLGGEN